MEKILIIEDEESILMALEDDLGLEGYEVTGVGDGSQGLSMATKEVYDLIILDVMLPGMNMRLCYEWDDAADVLEEFPNVAGMPVGSESEVTMRIHFSYNGASYGLAFGNLYQFTGEIYQGTDPVTVRREETDKWTIKAPPGAKAGLCLLDWKNGDPHYENIEMPFMVTLEVQQPKGGKKAPPASNLSSELTSMWGKIKADR